MTERLPIYDIEPEIIARLKQDRRLILSAPTGSGKSTQVPQMLLRHGLAADGQVVVLQPRRLATRLLAARVAAELGARLGEEVGYQIRFENVTSPRTRIRFVTEGVLLRQMIEDPELRGVAAILFDEFHERHLYGDITLARALEEQERRRPDLLLAVMSATLDLPALETYLAPCATLASAGRTFPVEVTYRPHRAGLNPPPVWELAAEAFRDYVTGGGQGDVLVFMPGGFEIAQTMEAIRATPQARGYLVLPLHGELPPADQDAAVARHDRPKVVVATNVAETSITIDGVRLVIDSGLARIARYDAHRGLNTLLVSRVSQASADQRAGRGGGDGSGHCARLWSRSEHEERAPQESPEIRRLDLAEVVLTLKASGVDDLGAFRWLEKPDPLALAQAVELLTDLGALEAGGRVTTLGRRMLAFPLHPRYARMLLAAQDYGCVQQACLVAALTQGRDLLLRSAGREVAAARDDLFGDSAASDFWILMRAWNHAAARQFRLDACRQLGIHAVTARQVGPLLDQFLRLAKAQGLDTQPRQTAEEALQKCILIGFSDRVARRLDEGTLRCELVHGRRGVLARESAVTHSPLLVAAEIREIEGRGQDLNTVISLATAIKIEWLQELFPADLQRECQVQYDARERRVLAAEILRFRGLALTAKRLDPPPADEAARLLAAEVAAGRLVLPGWDHGVEQWLARLAFLCLHCPDLQLPPVTPDDRQHIIQQLCLGATSFKDLKEREVKPAVMAWLSSGQQALLDRHAPERLKLPNDRTPRVNYENGRPPFISLRIQELYDVTQTPTIALGRVPVTVQILTPGMKPVQVTNDLASFWRDHYPGIKAELQRRYPRHFWR